MTRTERILVLKTFKFREADLIVHGLNSLGARVGFMAKGGAKSRKRFGGGVLEATHYIEVTYKVAMASTAGSADGSDPLHFLQEATLVRDFPKLREDYGRLETALYLVRLVHKLGQHGVVDSPELFHLLGNALQAAEKSENLLNLKLQFELKLLAAQGVLPEIEGHSQWLETSLAKHDQLKVEAQERQRLLAEVSHHLQQYIG